MRAKKKSKRSALRKASLNWRGYAITAKLKKHGLTIESYQSLLAGQDGKCAICHSETVGDSRSRDEFSWHIDHDHATGAVRGLLCLRCNIALGHAADNLDVLRSMIEYLEKHKPNLISVDVSVRNPR